MKNVIRIIIIASFVVSMLVVNQFQEQKAIEKSDIESDLYVERLSSNLKVYRYYGNTSAKKSNWYAARKYTNPEESSALPSGNSALLCVEVILPKGSEVIRGTVAKQFGRDGGGQQIYVP